MVMASTNQLAELRDIDTEVHAGWAKTGKSCYAFVEYGSPVCRFYIPPAYRDSHFHLVSPVEQPVRRQPSVHNRNGP